MYLDLYDHTEFDGDIHSPCFGQEIFLLCIFGPENQNYLFTLKFGIWPNSNMQNPTVIFTASVFDPEDPFIGQIQSKILFSG